MQMINNLPQADPTVNDALKRISDVLLLNREQSFYYLGSGLPVDKGFGESEVTPYWQKMPNGLGSSGGKRDGGGGLVNGKFYYLYGDFIKNQVVEYNPLTDTCVIKANAPDSRIRIAAGVIGSKIYTFGGDTKTNKAYDVLADSFASKADMTTIKRFSACAVVSENAYIIGGQDGNIYIDENIMYSPATDSYSTKAPYAYKAYGITAISVGGLIYLIGGNWNGSAISYCQAYNPVTNSYKTLSSKNSSLHSGAAATLNGCIYYIGGMASNYTSVVEKYNIASNTWSTTTDCVQRCYASNVCDVVNDEVYLIGGTWAEYMVQKMSIYDYNTVFLANIQKGQKICANKEIVLFDGDSSTSVTPAEYFAADKDYRVGIIKGSAVNGNIIN